MPRAPTPCKVGLIGCGGRGTGAAEQALRADPNVKLWAMGDAFRDRSTAAWPRSAAGTHSGTKIDVPAERQFVGFDAYQEVINSGVDVVLLATPPHFPADPPAGRGRGQQACLRREAGGRRWSGLPVGAGRLRGSAAAATCRIVSGLC